MIEELISRFKCKVREHQFDDRAHTEQCRTECKPAESILRDGCTEDPLWKVLARMPSCPVGTSAEVSYLLADDEDLRITPHGAVGHKRDRLLERHVFTNWQDRLRCTVNWSPLLRGSNLAARVRSNPARSVKRIRPAGIDDSRSVGALLDQIAQDPR